MQQLLKRWWYKLQLKRLQRRLLNWRKILRKKSIKMDKIKYINRFDICNLYFLNYFTYLYMSFINILWTSKRCFLAYNFGKYNTLLKEKHVQFLILSYDRIGSWSGKIWYYQHSVEKEGSLCSYFTLKRRYLFYTYISIHKALLNSNLSINS